MNGWRAGTWLPTRDTPTGLQGLRGSAYADVAVDAEEVVAAVGGVLQVGLEVVELGGADASN